MFPRWSRASAPAVYIATRGVAGFAFGLIVTVLPLMYIQTAGMSPLQLVLVGTVLETMYFVTEVPTGALADTYSRRFSVIVGFAISALAWIGQALLPVFLAILLFEAVRGIGAAFLSGARDAWIAGEVGEDAIGPLFMRGHQVSEAGWIVSIAVSVGLGSLDLRLPVVLGGVLFACLAVLLVVVMPEREFHRSPSTARPWIQLAATARDGSRVIRRDPLLLGIIAIAFFSGAASEGTDRLFEAHFLFDLGLPAELSPVAWFGLISIAMSAISIGVLQVLRPWLLRVVADDRMMARVIAVYTAAQMACQLAFAWAPGFAIGLTATFGRAFLTTGPVADAWTIRQIDPSVRATVLSMRGMLGGAGQVVGGPPVGAIGSLVGIRAALTASALLLAPTVALYLAASRRAPAGPEPDSDLAARPTV